MSETLQPWKMPDSYFGFNPVGDFCVYLRTRDSDTLVNSNWEELLKDFKTWEKEYPFDIDSLDNSKYKEHYDGTSTAPESWIYTFSASHWAVGWVEYLLLREDAPEPLRLKIEGVLYSLKHCYPIYNEDAFCEAEYKMKSDYWNIMDLKEKLYYCSKAGVSIFMSRCKDLPYEIEEYLSEF